MFSRLWLLLLTVAGLMTAQAPPVSLSVHLVVACSNAGAGPAVDLPGVPNGQCLEKTPFLTQRDVASAELHTNSKGHPTVFLTFHDAGALREWEITRKNVGGRVGIVVNGRLVAAPAVSQSSRLLYIDGNFAEKQALDLVTAFNKLALGR